MSYYIKISKIDYYTWQIGAIILLILCLLLIYHYRVIPTEGELKDQWWHVGYNDCERNFNFTVDEMNIINVYRINKIYYNNSNGISLINGSSQ